MRGRISAAITRVETPAAVRDAHFDASLGAVFHGDPNTRGIEEVGKAGDSRVDVRGRRRHRAVEVEADVVVAAGALRAVRSAGVVVVLPEVDLDGHRSVSVLDGILHFGAFESERRTGSADEGAERERVPRRVPGPRSRLDDGERDSGRGGKVTARKDVELGAEAAIAECLSARLEPDRVGRLSCIRSDQSKARSRHDGPIRIVGVSVYDDRAVERGASIERVSERDTRRPAIADQHGGPQRLERELVVADRCGCTPE